MTEIKPCHCGGEGMLDEFLNSHRNYEHFVRCRKNLDHIGPVVLETERPEICAKQAIEAWNEQQSRVNTEQLD